MASLAPKTPLTRLGRARPAWAVILAASRTLGIFTPNVAGAWRSACSGRCGWSRGRRGRRIGSPTQRIVLATLLAHLGEVVPIDVPADAVWEDNPPPSAVNTLRSQISRLRRFVGGRLEGSAAGYSLLLAPATASTRRFDHARRSAPIPGRPPRPRGRARGVAGPRLRRARRRRGRARRGPAPRAGTARRHRAGGRRRPRRRPLVGGRGRCEAVVAADDVREPSWAILVRALARAGRPAEALRAARRASAALPDAGLVPGLDLRTPSARRWTRRRPGPAPREPLAGRAPAPLTATIGRDDDDRRGVDALDDARLVTLIGPGGVGKSRLATDVAATAPPSTSAARWSSSWLVWTTGRASSRRSPPPSTCAARARSEALRDRRPRRAARPRQLRARPRPARRDRATAPAQQ